MDARQQVLIEQELRVLKGARDTVAVLHGLNLMHPIQHQSARAYEVYGEAADIIFDAFMPLKTS